MVKFSCEAGAGNRTRQYLQTSINTRYRFLLVPGDDLFELFDLDASSVFRLYTAHLWSCWLCSVASIYLPAGHSFLIFEI